MELTETKGITNQNHVFSLLTTGVMFRATGPIKIRPTCDHEVAGGSSTSIKAVHPQNVAKLHQEESRIEKMWSLKLALKTQKHGG